VEADGPDEVRKAVRAEIKAGADFIKFMASGGIGGMPEHEDPRWIEFSVEELKAGVEEARNRNKRTAAHAMGIGPVMNCLKAGIDCIEHGVGLNRQAVELMVSQGVYYIPTASGITDVSRREAEHGNPTLARLIEDVVVKPLYESIALAHQAGVPIGAGTDTLGDMVEELKLLHRCGLTPMECIRAATSVAATILGREADIGTVQTGKTADLLLVQGNPLEDLGVMQNVRDVFKAGMYVDEAFLCGTR
jgi:imidazolonepropionase-like amidohydrolase